ncbi:MAG: PAS domain S-box protein [Candidatus Sericytochromatia bacterium]
MRQALAVLPQAFPLQPDAVVVLGWGSARYSSAPLPEGPLVIQSSTRSVQGLALWLGLASESAQATDLAGKIPFLESALDVLCRHLSAVESPLSLAQQDVQRLKLLESVVVHSTDAVLITEAEPLEGPGPRIVYVNQAFTRMTGYSAAEVLGKTPRILQGPRTDRRELDRLKEALVAWKPCEVELLNYTRSGKSFWVQISIAPVADEQGWFTHWIAIQRDITVHKHREQQRELLSEIRHIFSQNTSFTPSIDLILAQILSLKVCEVAELWLANPQRDRLFLAAATAAQSHSQSFAEHTRQLQGFAQGEGLPGLVWQTGQPQLWQAVTERPDFLRREAARQSGLKSMYGLPLYSHQRLIGVLAVGSREHITDAQHFAPLQPEFGHQFGREIQRKQLEQELAQIFALAPDILCVTDRKGVFHKVNPAMCRLFGYSEADMLDLNLQALFHPEDAPAMMAALAQMQADQDRHSSEIRYLSASGKVRWLAWTSAFSADEELVFSVARDITPTRMLLAIGELNRRLVQESDWMQALAASLPTIGEAAQVDRVYFFKTQPAPLQTLQASQQLEWNRGVAPAQWHNPVLQNLPLDEFTDLMDCLHAGKHYTALTASLPAGKLREMLCAQAIQSLLILPVFAQGRLYGYLGFDDCSSPRVWRQEEISFLHSLIVNLSSAIDSRENARALEAAYTEKNTILESIGDAFFAMDRQWRITYCNHRAEQLLKTQRETIMGQNAWEMFPEAVGLSFRSHYEQALAEQKMVHFEAYFPPVESWFELSAYPSPSGLAIYFKDITERKNTEQQLQNLNQELQKHVKALASSNQELEQFAYVVSHDLQEPLRMITGFLKRLESTYGDLLDARGQRYVFFAVDGATRMRQMILELLAFSRIGKHQEQPQRLDLNQLVSDIVVLLGARIQEAQAQVSWSKLPELMGFQAPLRHLFQNLIDNALKYRDPERVPQIHLAATESDTHWEFALTDNGLGIEAENFEKIFVLFQRLEYDSHTAGNGVGLAVCKKIVESLGGRISLSSEKGRGSCFQFSIRKEREVPHETA